MRSHLICCFTVLFFLICGNLMAQEVHLKFVEAIQLTPERGYQTSCRGFISSETDSTVAFHPRFDTTVQVMISKSQIASFSGGQLSNEAAKEIMSRKGIIVGVTLQKTAQIAKATERKSMINGLLISVDSGGITLLPFVEPRDTIYIDYQRIRKIHVKDNSEIKGMALGTGIGLAAGLGLRHLARQSEKPEAPNNWDIEENVNFLFFTLTRAAMIELILPTLTVNGLVVGFGVGESADYYNIRGDQKKFRRFQNNMRMR